MATLQTKIINRFLSKLNSVEALGSEQIVQLTDLLMADKKPKADDFVKVFSAPPGGDLK